MSGFGLFYTLTSIFHQTVHIPIPTSAPTPSPTFQPTAITLEPTAEPLAPSTATETPVQAPTLFPRPDDTFNFGETIISPDPMIGNSYGPKDWNLVHCADPETCPGFPTRWSTYNENIQYTQSMCKDCSKPSKSCEFHAQSPIPLESTTATANRLCRDRHLMRFKTGNCKLEDVRFRILPHVLRAYQPACSVEPKLDFSFGFPDPWILQYTDIMIPSQHTLGGKRFSAEIVLTHTYSNKTMLDKLVGNLAIMVEVGTQQDHYPFFEVYLQRWERAASRIASTCSSNSTSNQASNITQTSNVTQPVVVARRLGTNLRSSAARHAQSNHAAEPLHRRLSNVSSQVPSNVSTSPPEEEESSRPQYIQEEYYQGFYHPYMFYKDTGTEYYFRYQGSVIEPPCIQNVHWRVMRLPITISPAQFRRLDQIFTTRLNPTTCEPETAGRPRITVRPNEGVSNSSIPTIKRDVTRPLQTITFDHKLVYCECANWPSIAPKDAMYCNQTMEERGVSNLTIVE